MSENLENLTVTLLKQDLKPTFLKISGNSNWLNVPFKSPFIGSLINVGLPGPNPKTIGELLNDKSKLSAIDFDLLVDVFPKPLNVLVNSFSSFSERFIVTMCALTSVGAILPNVYGWYHGRKSMPSLYLAVVAAAASNKGVVNYSKVLLKKVHKYYRDKSEVAFSNYQLQLKQQKQAIKSGGSFTKVKQPPYQVVVVSGDITGAKLLEQLYHNVGIPCILIEDEMDAVVQSGTGEHGKQINRLFRNIYHHAPISAQRKGDNQHYEVDEPFMSMIMAGTPDQFKSLLGSYENGLSSRFTTLTIDDGPIWLSPAPCYSCPNREDLLEATSEIFFELWDYMRKRKLEVRLTSEQWKVIDEFGVRELSLVYNFKHETLSALAKRTALQIFRIAEIITAFRFWEQRGNNTVATCSDADFEIAFKLIQHSYLCSLDFFKTFKGKGAISAVASAKDRLFQSLPDSFVRADVIEKASEFKISKRSADAYIKDFVIGEMLEKTGHGHFQKTSLAKHTVEFDELET